MPTKSELIKNATLNARNDWVDYTLAQEKGIYKLLDDTASQLIKSIEKFTKEGKVVPARLPVLLNQVKEEMVRLRPRLMGKVKTSMKNSIDYGIKTGIRSVENVVPSRFKIGVGSSFIDREGIVRKYDAKEEVYMNSAWAKINTNAMDALLRFNPSGITLSDRIWDISWHAEKAIRNRIQMAVLSGDSAAGLSRDIRGFLAEPEKLFRRVRKGGKLVLSKPAQAYHPGTGVYRSAYKNAMRLARTEMARAYTEGTIRYMKQKEWVDGVIWRTASGNPCPMCADLDGSFFLKDEPPGCPAHPNCFCYLELHIKSDII